MFTRDREETQTYLQERGRKHRLIDRRQGREQTCLEEAGEEAETYLHVTGK